MLMQRTAASSCTRYCWLPQRARSSRAEGPRANASYVWRTALYYVRLWPTWHRLSPLHLHTAVAATRPVQCRPPQHSPLSCVCSLLIDRYGERLPVPVPACATAGSSPPYFSRPTRQSDLSLQDSDHSGMSVPPAASIAGHKCRARAECPRRHTQHGSALACRWRCFRGAHASRGTSTPWVQGHAVPPVRVPLH
jgi:hypothetical protein